MDTHIMNKATHAIAKFGDKKRTCGVNGDVY